MIINHNLNAMNAHRQLGINTVNAGKSMEKLSSGLRINRAGDDAAGLAISEKMRGQIRGLNQASRNAQDGISLIQTAEGALNETHAILQRMRELAVQSSTDTNTGVDRSEIQKEMNELIDEIDRIANNTQFNEQNLLDGTFSGKKFHIGANAAQDVTLNITAMTSGASGGVSLTADKAEVDGVANTDVLKNGDDIVAVKIGSDWYAPDDVEKDASDALQAKSGATKLEVKEGKSIDGKGLYTEDTAEVDGVDDAVVLKDGDNIVAVKIGADWYAPDDVEKDGSDGLKAKSDATELGTVEDAYQLGGGSGGGLGVGSLKVDGVTKDSTGGIMTQEGASAAITTIQTAIETVSAERSKLGAMQNRLEHTIKNLDNTSENLQAAESRIRDVDMAKEMMNFSKNNILSQAAQAMLAQANSQPQGILQLLR